MERKIVTAKVVSLTNTGRAFGISDEMYMLRGKKIQGFIFKPNSYGIIRFKQMEDEEPTWTWHIDDLKFCSKSFSERIK